jgi:SAM-dependent methyltransferase
MRGRGASAPPDDRGGGRRRGRGISPVIGRLVGRVVGSPLVYNVIAWVFGTKHTQRRLRPLFAETAGQRVLDVGAGTGVIASLLPPGARYFWLDTDPAKLGGVRTRAALARAMLADATRLPVRDDCIDVAVCVGMSHHVPDRPLDAMLAELARVVRGRLIFLDALVVKRSIRNRILWALDRGRNPRTLDALRAAIERHFEIVALEEYSVHHPYMLCTAVPRASRRVRPSAPAATPR